jgi:ABC-type antimicrobial peptide transport system permease subunit
MAHSGSRRRREVSIRMALGAGTARVMRQFMTEGLVVAASGLVIGVIGATALTSAIGTLLFGVTPLDLSTYAAAAVALLAIAALASLVPAVRAARIDPVAALRAE